MPSDGNSDTGRTGHKRLSNALELGPRKKLCVCNSTMKGTCAADRNLEQHKILSYITADTLVEWSMPFVMSRLCLPTASSWYLRDQMMLMKTSVPCKWSGFSLMDFYSSLVLTRERLKFKIFRELLQMVPALEACLMESSEEEVMAIGELVMTCLWSLWLLTNNKL